MVERPHGGVDWREKQDVLRRDRPGARVCVPVGEESRTPGERQAKKPGPGGSRPAFSSIQPTGSPRAGAANEAG